MKNFHRFILLVCSVALLGGCATMGTVATVRGGECRVFKDPGFAVRGKRLKDSQWIGRTQETGIRVCHWQRPRA